MMGNKIKQFGKGLLIGAIIGLVILIGWYIWATAYYRWSDERIADLILAKYSASHGSELKQDELFACTDIKINKDTSKITATIETRKKINQKIVKSTSVTYNITSADNCDVLTGLNCIVI